MILSADSSSRNSSALGSLSGAIEWPGVTKWRLVCQGLGLSTFDVLLATGWLSDEEVDELVFREQFGLPPGVSSDFLRLLRRFVELPPGDAREVAQEFLALLALRQGVPELKAHLPRK